MSAITTLVENAIIDDLLSDAFLGQFRIAPHDADYTKASSSGQNIENLDPQSHMAITVTAFDWGDFTGTYGAGIRTIHVEVEILANVAEEHYDIKLDQSVELISKRLQPSTTLAGVTNRDFSTSELRVYGILDAQVKDERHDKEEGATRQRIVERTFVAAQLA